MKSTSFARLGSVLKEILPPGNNKLYSLQNITKIASDIYIVNRLSDIVFFFFFFFFCGSCILL